MRLRTSSTTSTPPGGLQAFYVPMELLVVQVSSSMFLSQMTDLSLQLSLFLADTLQAIGGILNLKWIYDGKVVVGSFCNAQGIHPRFVDYHDQWVMHLIYGRDFPKYWGDWSCTQHPRALLALDYNLRNVCSLSDLKGNCSLYLYWNSIPINVNENHAFCSLRNLGFHPNHRCSWKHN